MRVLLVSTYEMGHQPLGLAAPAAVLRSAGHDVDCLDLSVQTPEPGLFAEAELVGISIPMHTASRLGIELARRIRQIDSNLHIAFYGLYASPLHDLLMSSGLADSVIGGEYEIGLEALARNLACEGGGVLAGVGAVPLFSRQAYLTPDRRGLPHLDDYARLDLDGDMRLAGYVEASRGCAHTCTHCPITSVYAGRLRLVQKETVLADIDQLVTMGARHITFGDPDFLNALPHSLSIVEELHRRHPDATFDVTIKVEHLLEYEELLPRLRDLGCLFVTSAFESTNDDILSTLQKGHTREDLDQAVAMLDRVGLVLRPTWVAFTPWVSLEDFSELLEFVEHNGLVRHVQPVQYALKLLIPPGSPLIEVVDAQGLLGPLDPDALTYTWSNPDPRIFKLQAEVASIVEAATASESESHGEAYEVTFGKVKHATSRMLTGRDDPTVVVPQPKRVVPGLTEGWFC